MRKMTRALAWSGDGRSKPIHVAYPTRAPEEQMLVCELWASRPQA